MTGIERIAAAFAAARADDRAALMPYLMGGFPDIATSQAIGEAYADAGADLVELGVPFSDPLADGPVVQAAGSAALAAGSTVAGVLAVGRVLARRMPVALMCYTNIVLARGVEAFVAELVAHDISGLIVPDLPLEEATAVFEVCEAAGVALVPLVAPTTPDERLATIGARARGFVYTVSVVGTTGERAGTSSSSNFAEILTRVKAHTDAPVALGFGISTPDQAAAAAAAGADGVIVGSRLVRAAAQSDAPADATRTVVGELMAGLRR